MADTHAKWLRQAAEQIAAEGHNGWGNTCQDAAEHIATLRAQLAEAHAGLREADALLSDKHYLRYKADYECRGHLSYHNQIKGRERKFRDALARLSGPTDRSEDR